jgi:hypothetical protein
VDKRCHEHHLQESIDAGETSISGAPSYSYSDSEVENTKRRLCLVAAGPLHSPEVVDEVSPRTGQGPSDDATESVMILSDTAVNSASASSAMPLPLFKPIVPPSLYSATCWPSLALAQSASRRASNTATSAMVLATGTTTVNRAPTQTEDSLQALRGIDREMSRAVVAAAVALICRIASSAGSVHGALD